MPLPFVPSFAPTPLLLCAGCSAVVCTISSAVIVVDALGDTDAVVTAAYSIAASADSAAAATAATTAAQSAICVDVHVTCRAESPFAVRAVAPAAVARVVTVECRGSRDWPRRESASVCR